MGFAREIWSQFSLQAITGYGLLLIICSQLTWVGARVFPAAENVDSSSALLMSLLPAGVQFVSYLTLAAASYALPRFTKSLSPLACSVGCMAGAVMLLLSDHFKSAFWILFFGGIIVTNISCAGLNALWQRVFASERAGMCETNIIGGTALAVLGFFAIALFPPSTRFMLAAFIFVPANWLLLARASASIDYSQPLFADLPRDHRQVYASVRRNFWRVALCVGCFAFISGIVRPLTLSDAFDTSLVNNLAMTGSLAAAIALLLLRSRRSFQFDVTFAFRTLFPFMVTGILLIAFMPSWYLQAFGMAVHLLETLATMLITIQCSQASRDNGVNPLFLFCYCCTIMVGMNIVGVFTNWLCYSGLPMMPQGASPLVELALWSLALMFYLLRRRHENDGLFMDKGSHASIIEFPSFAASKIPDAHESNPSLPEEPSSMSATEEEEDAVPKCGDAGPEAISTDYPLRFRDRFSKQCAEAALRFHLTARESEIAELIARGNSASYIAKTLYISENTVRFHTKNIYMKFGVHKRQELINLVQRIEEHT